MKKVIIFLLLIFPTIILTESNWNREIDSILKIEKPFWNFGIRAILDKIPKNDREQFINELIDRAEAEKKHQLAGRIYLSSPHYDGLSIYNQNQYSQFLTALEYFQKENFHEGIVEANIYLGLNFKSLDDIERMEYYFREANRVAQTSNKEYLKLTGYWTMFELMNFIDKLDSSKYYMHLCDSLYALCKFPSEREKVHANFLIPRFKSIYYAKLNQYDSAAHYFKISFEKNRNRDILNASSTLVLSPRDAQLNLEFLIKYVDENEIESFKNGIVINNTGEDVLYQKVYRTFGDYYKYRKMYDSAMVYYEKALSHYDSAYYKDPRLALSKMEQEKAEIEFRAKEELAAQQTKYIIYAAIALLIVLLLITWFIYTRYKDKARVNEKLNELNSTKDKLFAIISHDLRSPLASLMQMLELISLRFDKMTDESKQKYINNLRISSNKMYLMLDNLLNWAKINLGNMQYNPSKINILQIVKSEADLLKENLENKNVKLQINNEINQDLLGDENLIRIAVRNLLSNGMKFSPKDSTLECHLFKENGMILISVIDYGKGMNQNQINAIINNEKLVTKIGTANEKGNGLGLFITQEAVKIHKGNFKIESLENKFTKMIIELPQS